MNTDSYKVLKLSNGEMIVCEINDYDDKMYDIMNPLKMDVVPIQSRSGIGETLNLTPWLQHFTDQKYFNIDKSHCILIADASVGLSKYYEYVMLRSVLYNTYMACPDVLDCLYMAVSHLY